MGGCVTKMDRIGIYKRTNMLKVFKHETEVEGKAKNIWPAYRTGLRDYILTVAKFKSHLFKVKTLR